MSNVKVIGIQYAVQTGLTKRRCGIAPLKNLNVGKLCHDHAVVSYRQVSTPSYIPNIRMNV